MKTFAQVRRMARFIGIGFALATLAGCAAVPGPPLPVAGPAAIHGAVHGGQSPISGASVALYSAGTSGYGSNATVQDFTSTAADGSFSLTGNYTCPSPHSQMFLLTFGGDPGGGTNSNLVLMSALGDCTALTTTRYVVVDEVTTVASIVALQPFITSQSQIGTSSTNLQGMQNAFLTVASLADLTTGVARSATPAGNGTPPLAELNTLANILAQCVNSTGGVAGDGSACGNLFSAATPPSGPAPTSTFQAMLDIAQNPGNNVTAIFDSPTGTVFFAPTLQSIPNDWTVAIAYTGGLSAPQIPAIDANGNVWVTNDTGNSLTEFDPLGAVLSGTFGFTSTGLVTPYASAVDLSGNVWVANAGSTPGVNEFDSSGAVVSGSPYKPTGLGASYGIAIDGSGSVYVSVVSSNEILKLSSSGSLTATISGGGLSSPAGLAIDGSGNVWAADQAGQLSEFSSSGAAAASSPYSGGGIQAPHWVAMDSLGEAWVANDIADVSEFSNAGTALSPPAGYAAPALQRQVAIDGNNTVWVPNSDQTGSITGITHLSSAGVAISPSGSGYTASGEATPVGLALDGSGNAWVTDNGNKLFEFVGVSVPVVTPLALAVKNHTLGTRP